MASKLSEYVEAGFALSPQERLEAARMLRLSVDQDIDSDQAEIDSSWADEIQRRFDDVVAGRVELVDADETYRALAAEFDPRRT